MLTTHAPIKETRKSFGLSQEQLGRVLGASWISISRWERGISNPPPEAEEKLRRLAELLEHLGGLIAPADLPQFLLTPNPAMQNFPPYDLLQSGYSFQKLIELVEKTKSGEFS